jgi:hypothetical protein
MEDFDFVKAWNDALIKKAMNETSLDSIAINGRAARPFMIQSGHWLLRKRSLGQWNGA